MSRGKRPPPIGTVEVYKNIHDLWVWRKYETPNVMSKGFKHKKDCEKDAEKQGYIKY